MTKSLLPPDATRDGWYWVKQAYATKPVQWDYSLYSWVADREIIPPWYAHRNGWRLASPHPIPVPERLDSLHALKDEIVQIGAEMTDSMSAGTVLHGIVKRLGQRFSVVIEGKP